MMQAIGYGALAAGIIWAIALVCDIAQDWIEERRRITRPIREPRSAVSWDEGDVRMAWRRRMDGPLVPLDIAAYYDELCSDGLQCKCVSLTREGGISDGRSHD